MHFRKYLSKHDISWVWFSYFFVTFCLYFRFLDFADIYFSCDL